MPKISIIIPFNNVEEYIEQCLKSVITQTLKDIEIICINDASRDKSKQIVEQYAKKDERIKIIDIKERHGQGYARNRGIETAKGEYIGFVDADDFIEPEMFYELYKKAKENDNDITICQAREYDDINKKFIISDYYSLSLLEKMGDKVFSAEDTIDELLNINVVLWNKIYKKKYLEKIGEKFPEGYIYEDLPFFFGTYLPAKRIQIVWKNFYIYRINRKNSTMQQFNKKILDRLDMVSLTYEKFKKFPFLNNIQDKIKGWIINDLFHRYTLLKDNLQKEYFFNMKKIFMGLDIDNPTDKKWQKIYHFQGYLLVINNNFNEFNSQVFNEYLDIHKVEDRLRSEICTTDEIDKKISGVYEDISKNYEYTNKLADDLKYEIQVQTDEKLSGIFNSIETIKSDFNDNLQNNITYINNETDKKISKLQNETNIEFKNIYEEIAFNYAKTTEIFQNKINDVKTTIYNTKEELNKKLSETNQNIQEKFNYVNAITDDKISKIHKGINEEIKNLYENNAKNYEKLNTIIDNTAQNIKQTIRNEEELKIKEINENIDYTKETLKSIIENNIQNVSNNIEQEKNNNNKNIKYLEDTINKIEENFENKIKSQQKDYENKINILTERINYLSQNPIKRFFKKLKRK